MISLNISQTKTIKVIPQKSERDPERSEGWQPLCHPERSEGSRARLCPADATHLAFWTSGESL